MQRTVMGGGLLLLALVACRSDSPLPVGPGEPAELGVQLLASRVDAAVGDTIAVALELNPPAGSTIAGLQGRLKFDPQRLRYLGQPLTDYLVMVNSREADQGRLRFLSLSISGLGPVTADLRFEVLAPEYRHGLAYTFEEAVTRELDIIRRARTEQAVDAWPVPPTDAIPRRLTADDWTAHLDPAAPRPRTGPLLLPGAGLIYGDANLSGAVTVSDVVAIASAAVGNLQLLTPANRDFAIAANVAPANLPGLGEAADPLPPGRNPDGTFTITVGDATVTGNEAVGNNAAVAGEPIPGRTAVTNRVIITDSIKLDRTFYRDTIYELQGTIIVGNPEVEHVTLTIEAGTRVEGDAASRGALVIRRGAKLIAVGTRLEPIIFTCNAVGKVPGCWGGVTINGFSLLNNGDPVDGGVIPVKLGKGGTGYYGGALVQDSSGALSYLRIEYAGKPTFQGDILAGLGLLGVGSLTHIDHIQVHGSLSDGIFISGGTSRLRHTLITNGQGHALRWDDGWKGKGQFLLIHQGDGSQDALRGSNFFLAPNALPRSTPILSHMTVVGPAIPQPGSHTIFLENGSAGMILNSVFLRAAEVGLEIEGDTSCDQIGDSLTVVASIFQDHPTQFSGDADCLDEAAFATDPTRMNRQTEPGLNAPFNTLSPDFRPLAGAVALTGDSLLPSDFFFDLSARYLGAAEPMNAFGSNVPWYAGWTVGW